MVEILCKGFICTVVFIIPLDPDTIITMKLSNLLLALSLSLGLHGSVVAGQEAATVAEEAATSTSTEEATIDLDEEAAPPVQVGPLVDLLGPSMLSLEMIDSTHAQYVEHTTSDALRGKKVIGLYFSADW
jgi:hypothetical protein